MLTYGNCYSILIFFVGCVNCHAGKDDSGAYAPINESGQFCADCHEQVGTSMDCFSCHRTTPGTQHY